MATLEQAKPRLLAILICEKIILDEQKIPSLIQVIDTFTIRGEVEEIPGRVVERRSIVLEFQLYTKWGLGQGEFTDELRLVLPNGKEAPEKSLVPFKMPGGFHFHQNRRIISFAVSESGMYAFRVYLDNELMAEHPFQVNIELKVVPPKRTSRQE